MQKEPKLKKYNHHIYEVTRSLLLTFSLTSEVTGGSAMTKRPSSSLSVLFNSVLSGELELKESWYSWSEVELEAEEDGLKNGLEDGDSFPMIRPFSVRVLGGCMTGGFTSSRSLWLFLAFINSAASALDMFSCFFHFVRRFWNQILTWNYDFKIRIDKY